MLRAPVGPRGRSLSRRKFCRTTKSRSGSLRPKQRGWRFRRMHVYTPPGYESGKGKYPVFYLLHGASDSDASWSSIGRAGFILDNLIAAKKAKPMVMVMPAGHTGPFMAGARDGSRRAPDEFVEEFEQDIMPHIEKTYRVYKDQKNRAMA